MVFRAHTRSHPLHGCACCPGQKQVSKFVPRETVDAQEDPAGVSPQNISTLLQVSNSSTTATRILFQRISTYQHHWGCAGVMCSLNVTVIVEMFCEHWIRAAGCCE